MTIYIIMNILMAGGAVISSLLIWKKNRNGFLYALVSQVGYIYIALLHAEWIALTLGVFFFGTALMSYFSWGMK